MLSHRAVTFGCIEEIVWERREAAVSKKCCFYGVNNSTNREIGRWQERTRGPHHPLLFAHRPASGL